MLEIHIHKMNLSSLAFTRLTSDGYLAKSGNSQCTFKYAAAIKITHTKIVSTQVKISESL